MVVEDITHVGGIECLVFDDAGGGDGLVVVGDREDRVGGRSRRRRSDARKAKC